MFRLDLSEIGMHTEHKMYLFEDMEYRTKDDKRGIHVNENQRKSEWKVLTQQMNTDRPYRCKIGEYLGKHMYILTQFIF